MNNSIEELTNDIDKEVKKLEDNEIDTVDKLTDYIDKKLKILKIKLKNQMTTKEKT